MASSPISYLVRSGVVYPTPAGLDLYQIGSHRSHGEPLSRTPARRPAAGASLDNGPATKGVETSNEMINE